MKHNYLNMQRLALHYVITVWLVVLSANLALSQQRADINPGVVRIKVTEQLAQRLEASRMSRNADNVLLTGIQSLDRANIRHKATTIKRVFRDGGKFEAKHRRYGLHRWYEIQIDKTVSVTEALASYRAVENIEKVEPSFKKSIIGSGNPNFGPVIVAKKDLAKAPLIGPANDPLLGSQWNYNNTGQAGGTPGSDIRLFQAWGIEAGTPNVIVAVTDGGAQVNHPDLAANMWINTDEIPGNDLDDDNNGFVDDINGYGFGDDTGEIAPDDHGTHTSGTVAAVTNNGIGVAGVAGGTGAGDGARIMTLAAFGGTANGGFEESYVYGADNGAVISQNSWGYELPDVFEQSVLDAIDYFIAEAGKDANGNQVGPMRGGIVIFAAGNNEENDTFYPGFYDKTLAVGALTNRDQKAWYSNYGDWVDISAPGGETFVANDPRGILSTIAGNQYAFFQGTSMACPHVSGTAALIISKFGGPGFTPEMLRGRLTQLVDNVDAADPEFAGLLGTGRLNAFKALQEDDGDAPEEITDLTASNVNITSITLTWTSPDDPGIGSASAYDLRYATFPITSTNFDSATQVVNPPVPLAAGTTQSYTVSGLSPGTVYYFAIRSADFFGNYSDISNVVEQATNFPPVVSVSPDSLVVEAETAEIITTTLTISNSGLGPLSFHFDSLSSTAFATPVPDTGTIAANSTLDISITIDANDLLPGTYHQDLILSTNDPETPSLTIPVTLNVISNGSPIASFEPDTLDFGEVFETGFEEQTVTVHNAGADTLYITSVSSSNTEFTTDFPDSLAVAPFDDAIITVTYNPSGLGESSGVLTITTNDPENASFTIHLLGEGVPAPDIEVTPTSLSATLNTGGTATRTLTLRNTGGSDLEFSVDVTTDSTAKVVAVKTITIPQSTYQSKNGLHKATAKAKYPNRVELRSVSQTAAVASVLILTPDSDVSDIESILDGFADVEADVFPVDSLPFITLADLTDYDVVFTTNNGQWLASGEVDPEVIGDLLADYIDAGGKVISNSFTYSYDAWKLEGRFIDEQYGPFTPATSDEETTVELGDILAPSHPIIQGVEELEFDGFVQNVGLAPGATAIAEWDNGELFLAANDNVVALNLLPSLGNGDPLQFTGDLPLIYQNAIHFLSAPGFVEVNPSEGTIAAGAQLELEVIFYATGLDSGVYEASINIATNVPNEELITIPAVLNVLGPEFTVSPDSLAEELEKNQTSMRTLVLRNNGSDNQTFTVDVEGADVGVSIARKPSNTASEVSTVIDPSEKIHRNSRQRTSADFSGKEAINFKQSVSQRAVPIVTSQSQYATDFETFNVGNINGQQNWFGQFGNWRVEAANPSSGSKHFRGLADGLGLSAAFTPAVPIGTEEKSTTSMKLNIKGTGVTWQIIPESTTAELVNTRIQFDPNGVVSALIPAGEDAVFDDFATTPVGYFDLTIEVDRDSAYFDVYFNNTKVYTGQGFTGNIEEVVILSGMEKQGPTLDVDDLRIIDGTKDAEVTFLTVSPLSGNLPAGSSVELEVTFNSNNLDFGTYHANINIHVAETTLTVPASLRVFGDPNIDVDPTFLQATVDYKEDTTKFLTITNTGGNPLNYSLQVIGAATDRAKIVQSKSKQSKKLVDAKTLAKIADDEKKSRPIEQATTEIQLLAGSPLLQEDFEDASFPPSGWQVVDNIGSGVVWKFASEYGEDNYSGTGEAATASSDAAGKFEYDTELITPSISTAGFKNISVQYNANYQNLFNLDFLDLDIQVDGGAWTNVLRWNEDQGELRGTGVSVTQELGSFIGSGGSFRLRWHYYNPNPGDFDWYAQIDDVVVYGDPRAWLSVSPSSGTIPVNGTATIAAKFDASDIEAGTYVGGIIVSSNAVEDPLIGVLAQLTVRNPAIISVTPSSLYQELLVDEQAKQTLTISNSGPSVLKFAFGNTPVPNKVSPIPQERRQPTALRTTRSSEAPDLMGIKAIRSGSGISQSLSTQLYVTGFEDFAPGDLNGQKGWEAQFNNWSIESDNPYEGSQHITSESDGLGATRAFSPTVAIGVDPISSTSMFIDLEEGATWQVIPQSPTAELVITRISFDTEGGLSAMVKDSTGNAVFIPVEVSLPEGYFELRIDVERATSIFTLFIDGAVVFRGNGFTGSIEEVVLFGAMEATGSTLYVDNFAIYDGPAIAPWLSVNPQSGIVPPGGSTTITVEFDATDLEAGVYTDTLKISSNDPVTSRLDVPVTLKVLVNTPPVLSPIDTVEIVELDSVDVTFTATDIDNEYISVALKENLAFVTLVDTTSGSATYRIQPSLGDRGEYDLEVIATDARGKQDTEIFHLTVVPYGVESLTLFNARTNTPVATFTDTIEVDIAQPDFSRLTIRANTNPARVGSVKFWIDNRYINVDNTNPYSLGLFTLPFLAGGDHTLVARSYTGSNGTGREGKSVSAFIRIVNSAAVSDFDIVRINGSKISDLEEGMVIDIRETAYRRINIKANTTGGKVRSVVFTLNGVKYRVDNLAPYQLSGLGTFIDLPWSAVPGTYTLSATPYSEWYGLGVAGESLTINFTVTNGVSNASARTRGQQMSDDGAGVQQNEEALRIYPVPVQNELHVELDEANEGIVGFVIHNSQGQQIFSDDGSTNKFRSYTINTSAMIPGVYFIHVRYPNGKMVVRKFIKE